jgi:DNA-binding NarL/FixJ family response regulator
MKYQETVRIVVADDFADWRILVRSLLEAHPKWKVIAEACDGLEAVEKTAELRPDIVILDIAMPGMNGIEAAMLIACCSPGSKIIFLSGISGVAFRNEAIAATGAVGFVLKIKAASELQRAVEAALQVFIAPVQSPVAERGNLRS